MKTKQNFGRTIKAGALVVLLIASIATAGTFDIIMDVDGGSMSATVSVAHDPWDNTNKGLSETNESLTNQVNVENTGDVPIDIYCNCSDTDDWTIENTIGADNFRLQCKNSTGAYINMGTSDTKVYTNLGTTDDEDFRFKLYLPSSTTSYVEQTAVVSFTYVEFT